MFRQYHGGWARFDQPDPFAGSYRAGDPQSFNRYSYTQNDPVNFTDPSGLDIICHPDIGCWDDGMGPVEVYPGGGGNGGGGGGSRRAPQPLLDSGIGSRDVGGGIGVGGPQITTSRDSEDPCDSSKFTSEIEKDLREAAGVMGGKLGHGWEVQRVRGSFADVVKRLENAGFGQFTNINPPHWGGLDFEGKINGRWYHVTVMYPNSRPSSGTSSNSNRSPNYPNNSATNSRGHSPGGRPSKIDVHCESARPSSVQHAVDWLGSWTLW